MGQKGRAAVSTPPAVPLELWDESSATHLKRAASISPPRWLSPSDWHRALVAPSIFPTTTSRIMQGLSLTVPRAEAQGAAPLEHPTTICLLNYITCTAQCSIGSPPDVLPWGLILGTADSCNSKPMAIVGAQHHPRSGPSYPGKTPIASNGH